MIKMYRAGEFRLFATGIQVMEGTIIVYIKIIDKMIPKISLNSLLICWIGREVLITGREFHNLGNLQK